MLIDCRSIPDGTTVHTDVCIVGAGPAGVTIAQALDGTNLRVALLEEGGPPSSALGLDQPQVTSVDDSDFDPPLRIPPRFGGGANEWLVRLPWMHKGVRMVPLSPFDLEARDWIPNSGWPIEWDELDRYYQRAYRLLGFAPADPDAAAAPSSPDLATIPLEAYGFTTALERFASPRVFTRDAWARLIESENVTVHLHAPIGMIDGEANRVAQVAVDAPNQGSISFAAATTVLATGGIENARLLLAARDGRGYGNTHDVHGRYYMDHLRFVSGSIVPHERHSFNRLGTYDIHRIGTDLAMGKVVPTASGMADGELLNSAAMLLPKPSEEMLEVQAAMRESLGDLRRRSVPQRWPTTPKATLRALAHFGHAIPEMAIRQRRFPPHVDAGWSSTWGNAHWYRSLEVEHQIEQAPDPQNRITLGTARDVHGRRRAELRWKWSDLDLRSIRSLQKAFGNAVAASGFGEYVAAQWDTSPSLTTPEGAFHPTGATRMHPNPRLGSVDVDGRVHGVDNLYVAGSSTFPTSGYANPTLTIVALALRLADHLR